MSRYIDAEWLKQHINTSFWTEIEKIIDSAPSVDSFEIAKESLKEIVDSSNTIGDIIREFIDMENGRRKGASE